jgi:glutaredoxin
MKTTFKSILVNTAVLALTIAVAIPIGRYAPKLYERFQSHGRDGDYSAHIQNLPYKVTLYGTTTCVHCIAARAHLRQAGIDFNDMVIDKSAAAGKGFERLEVSSVPVLVTPKRIVVGFAVDEYDALLRP